MSDPSAGRVELETCFYERIRDGVVVLTFNRPDRGNGVVPELARDLLGALDELEPDRSVRVVVLTGAGKQFSAGADLVAMRDYVRDRLAIEQEPYNARVLFPVTQRLTTSRLIFVAAINGGATAGGLDLALACDVRVASDRARLGETYVNMGLAPGNGGSWFLPKLVGSGRAAELALTGEVVDAQRALEIGLVGRVVPHEDLIPAAVDLASTIAAKPWRALEATKQSLRASWLLDLSSSMSASFWQVAALHHTDDFREAIDAFLAKRTPMFNQGVSPVTGDPP
jgi:enoyl-CoA hydratase